jgi:hypothetical protein
MKLKKRKITEIELGGQDSFLDLVSNIVGILIILVMVAGIRAQFSSANIPDLPKTPAAPQTLADLETKYQELQTKISATAQKRHSAEELQQQSQIVAEQIHQQSQEYAALFDLMTSVRAAIDCVAEEKSQTFKEKIEYQRQLLETNAKLEQLDRAKTHYKQIRPQATVMENIPTPLAETVKGKEIHFRLLGGRIAYVPIDEMIQLVRRHADEEKNRYIKQRTNVGKVGPIENFDLEFLLITYSNPAQGGYDSRGIGLEYGELVPRFEPMGEPIRSALASPQSEFRRKLSRFIKDYTVTVWVYPDSFEAYQELKQFLYEQGYSVAARPTAMGQPIGVSPYGTRSSSQ